MLRMTYNTTAIDCGMAEIIIHFQIVMGELQNCQLAQPLVLLICNEEKMKVNALY
jgi:hypothetical protein